MEELLLFVATYAVGVASGAALMWQKRPRQRKPGFPGDRTSGSERYQRDKAAR